MACVHQSIIGSVLWLEVTARAKLNAFDREALRELNEAIQMAHAPYVATVIVSCLRNPGVHSASSVRESERAAYRNVLSAWSLAKPVIAAIDGSALGLTLALIGACDIRICGSNSVFGPAAADCHLDASPFCDELPSDRVTRLTAQQAWRQGFVHDVVPEPRLRGRAHELAVICSAAPDPLAAVRRLSNELAGSP